MGAAPVPPGRPGDDVPTGKDLTLKDLKHFLKNPLKVNEQVWF